MIDFKDCLDRAGTQTEKESHKETILSINELLSKYGVRVNSYIDGPTVTTYIVKLNVSTRINAILRLESNFAIATGDNDTRIYQDGDKLKIEVKNEGQAVRLRELLTEHYLKAEKERLLMMIGKDTSDTPVYSDLRKAPHMIVCGTTGSGKSIFLHQIIMSLIMSHPYDVSYIGIDMKGTELAPYGKLDNFSYIKEYVDAIGVLRNLCQVMDTRYEQFIQCGCRDIDAYCSKVGKMPRIVCFIDEFADLMDVAGDEIEGYVVRLAQKARACGIHLIIATQSPRRDVLTGLIQANIPTRAALSVTDNIESRIALGRKGAEKLIGKGDCLFLPNGRKEPIRVQGAYVDEKEIEKVVDKINNVKAYLKNTFGKAFK